MSDTDCTIIKLTATNDANGNPRRVFVVLPHEKPWEWIAFDEGYDGDAAVPPQYLAPKNANIGPCFDTTPAEYRGILRDAKVRQRGAK